MEKFTRYLLLMLMMVLSSSLIIGQVNPAISVNNPNVVLTQQTKELPSQQDLQALKGPADFIPASQEGSRLVGDNCTDPIFYGNVNDPSINGNLVAGGNVWYSFTAPVNMLATVSLCGGSSMDTKLDIYADCSSAYLFYNDDYCGALSQISNIPIQAGQTLYARVYGYSSTTAGPFNINITGVPEPANDECTTAQPISGPYPQSVNGTTIGAYNDCPGVLNWNAVWYQIQLPYAVNNVSIDYCGTIGSIPTVGVVYYNNCSDCAAYTGMSYVFHSCGDGYTNPKLTATNIAGPTTIYFPVYVGATAMNFHFTVDVTSTGNLDGHVTNYYGLAISGATVVIPDLGLSTVSDPGGYYSFMNIAAGTHQVGCVKAGFNPISADVFISPDVTTTHDFVLTQPNMVVNPLYIEETLNPGEYFTTSLNVLNNGTGPLGWAAEIVYPEMANSDGNVIVNPPGYQTEQVEPNGAASTGYGAGSENGSRDLMVCPEGSLFSIPPQGANNGYTSTASLGYKCYQSYSGVEGPISTITFWGIFAGYTLPTTPGNFLIELYQPGSMPGALVTSVTASLVGVNTGVLVAGSYQCGLFTVEIPPTDLPAGWLAVQFQSSPTFYWVNSLAGAGFPAYQNTVSLPERLAMCLAGGSAGATNWLTMDSYEGTVPGFGGVANIPTHLDAAGTAPGEVYTANVVFTSTPNVATISVPVTMIIMGPELIAPENLTATLINDVTGEVRLTWEWTGDAFQFFMIKRDGVIVGTTTNLNFTDLLPDYGEFCYTVQAVYDEGQTSPAGPECIEWPNPLLYVNPSNLEGWVWAGFTVDVYTTISNLGVGTLAYTFPEFAAMNLINDPNIEHNQTGSPVELRSEIQKGDESLNGSGYPVVLGAGGPDNFGYIWIDSDENGGPTYDWIDITATGTALSTASLGDDGKVGPYPLGFNFEYYGEIKTQFWVASNGAIGFNSASLTYTNTGLPTNNSAYTDFLALFWDDLNSTYAGTSVLYQNFTDYTIVQWNDAQRLSYAGSTMDMQAIIYKNGKIKMQYKDINGFTTNSGTIGLQSSTASLGLQVVFNANYVHNNLAILYSLPADFIIAVQPASGTIASGESQSIKITYDSQDYEPGDYTQDLVLESNDPNTPEFVIGNTMHVYIPAQFAGAVVDNDDQSPIPGVIVTAGAFQTTTNDEGMYSLYVDAGNYNVTFEKLGYMTVTVADTMALQGVVTPLSVGMWDNNYAPGLVHAEVMDNDTWCEVTWTLPDGPYEIVMDDGQANDYFIWSNAGNMDAVKFTPAGYPATAIGGQIYVGDGSFPGAFLGTQFGIAIFDDDGPNGLPGTMLDSNGVTVNNYGWVSFDWLSATITDGSFYLAMIQTAPAPFAAPIGVDLDNPTYFKSYVHFAGAPSWVMSPMQDFMMRAWVDGPESDAVADNATAKVWRATPKVPANWQQFGMTKSGTLPKILPAYERNDVSYKGVAGMENRNVTNYRVARYSNFDPNGSPAAGTLSELGTTANLYYNDNAFAGLPQGWYAYGVKALYTSGLYSSYTISNIVGHLMDYQVTVNVTLSTGLEPINVEVTLKGLEYPYDELFAVTPTSGTVVFDQVWRGHYDISAFKIGYDTYTISNAFINSDKVYNIVLSEKKYAPTCLTVDPVSLVATWCEPLRTAIDENFENPSFPPAGWQVLTQGDGPGWERTDDGSSASWIIPTWDSFYAMSNDDAAGSESDGCCDYLITPAVDLRESEGYAMTFNSYYDGAFGQLAFVEYSVDGGATWEVLNQMTPATSWSDIELDLSAFSGLAGPAQIQFAFHSDDAGAYASGWAVDNIKIQVPAPAASYLDFWVFLDNAFEGVTNETTWNYAPLTYGVTYTASVAARYTSGLSAKDTYTFQCKYLFPPDSLTGTAPDNAALLQWFPPWEYWPPVASSVSDGPKYSNPPAGFIAGVVSDELATNRSSANDQVIDGGTREVGDVLSSFPAPSPIGLCWGICDDGSNLWITDPNVSATNIYQVDYDGVNTGTVITISLGQSWVGDMVSDGTFLYGCLVGGPNTIVKVDLATGETVEQITGAWTVTSQRGLGADFELGEWYIGGWNSNQIWRADATGATISTFGFSGVSGLAWHPVGGPNGDGSLWVMVNAGSDVCTEVDPNNSWATIQSFVMPNDAGGSGAGAEIKRSNPDGGAIWLCNQSNNTVYLVDLAEPWTPGPGTGGMPENILGYNIYRDGDFVAYTPQTPAGEFVPQYYIDQNLQPGIYQYTVTGVYDLTPYGYAGETGESMEEGPAEVVVDFCYDLEFVETWSLGSFDNNNWLTDGSNWTINGQAGNPSPAAEFSWDPIQTNYESSLTSYPMCATGMTEGKIWLDFDLKLNSVQPTGEELIQAQVWNWETQVWNTVAEYSNADGSFDWTAEHINIKPQAMDKVFKIRFHAMGVNSINILGWLVDNIHVYRACDAASELTAQASGVQHGIVLNWTEPFGSSIDEWIHWDDGTNAGNAIGTGGAAEFDVASRWEPSQLANYEGAAVTQVAFFPAEASATYRVRVWIGAGAANLVCDQAVTPIIGQWNTVTLTTPVPVDLTQELWVGYYINTPAGYPAGVDDGPAIDGYGDMMNFGGWQTLLQINPDLDFNWNLSVHLMTVAGATMPLSRDTEPNHNANAMSFTSNPNAILSSHVFETAANGSRELSGYNVYRGIDGENYALIDFTTTNTYVDTDDDLIISTNYCYMVSAVWTSETDQCESAFSNEACEVWTSISDPNATTGSFNLYPNPASDHVYITTSGDLKRVTVYNALGQLVTDEITTGKQYELSTASYTIGVYMVRVETEAGVTTRTLTVQR